MSRLLFVACAVCLLVAASATVRNDDTDFIAFQKFMLKYNKTYSTMHELKARFAIFQLSLDRVEGRKQAYYQKHGQVCPEALFGVTKFSDLTPAEFKSMYLGSVPPRQPASAPVVADDVMATPTSVDWRKKGAVTPVKDQQQCGSCWAFSATETIESQSFLNHGTLQVLSPQQITSCDTTDGGCGGGWPDTAYQYVQGAGGITTDKAYPYIDGDGNTYPCNLTSSMPLVVGVKNFSFAINPCYDTCASQNETALAAAVATKGPLSICVDAEPWQDYVSGVFNSDCANTYSDLDHCVQLVGYESTASTPYWIVRNSWNTDWGIEGYIWLGMGSNVCGVADHVTYPHAFAQN